MQELPKYSAIIYNELGDGFKTVVLPNLIQPRDLLITHRVLIGQYRKDGVTSCIQTYHGIHKINSNVFNRVIIDCRLPRPGSKGLANLVNFCKGKVVIILGSSLVDARCMSSALCILQSAKVSTRGLKVMNFSRFQHMRGY